MEEVRKEYGLGEDESILDFVSRIAHINTNKDLEIKTMGKKKEEKEEKKLEKTHSAVEEASEQLFKILDDGLINDAHAHLAELLSRWAASKVQAHVAMANLMVAVAKHCEANGVPPDTLPILSVTAYGAAMVRSWETPNEVDDAEGSDSGDQEPD